MAGIVVCRSPVVKIQHSKTFVGQPIGTKVATFSSRGPNSIAPAILKVCMDPNFHIFLIRCSQS